MNTSTVSARFPLISVIIPAYNAEAFIERTLHSVLSQTYRQIEVLVVDDGSSDRTPEIVKAIAEADPRVVFFSQANAGVALARNLAIAHANGEWIAPIDADDIWYPKHLEKQVQCCLQSDESVGVVYSWSLDIDENDSPIDGYHTATIEGDVFATLLCHNFIGNASATLIRKTCLDTVGGYDPSFKQLEAQGCEDWDLYLRLAESYQFRVVPEFLVGYRKIAGSMSRNYGKMAQSHELMIERTLARQSGLPAILFKLSRSSFYLYLAQQSREIQCYRGTLYWLSQAVRADHVTPLLRLGWYILVVESFVRLALKEISAFIGPENPYWMTLKTFLKHRLTQTINLLPQSWLRKWGVKFKVLISDKLHHFLPFLNRINGNSKAL